MNSTAVRRVRRAPRCLEPRGPAPERPGSDSPAPRRYAPRKQSTNPSGRSHLTFKVEACSNKYLETRNSDKR